MADIDIVRAWKDAKYRRSLTDAQRAALPPNPAGMVELTDTELANAAGLSGAAGGPPMTTAITCTMYTWGNNLACGCGPATTAITCTEYTWNHWKACCW